MIIEEAENLEGARIATVRTKRGEEVLINVDRTIEAVADLMSDFDHEHRLGWTLEKAWFVEAFKTVRCAMEVTA